MKEKVFTAYIGTTDIYEWTMGVGKSILMPNLLNSCEKLYKDDLETIHSVRIESVIRGKQKSFDIFINKEGVDETLSKIMEWALENEEYEICQRIKDLEEMI